jgi:hypothetical protein
MKLFITILLFTATLGAQLAPPDNIIAGKGAAIGSGNGELLVFGPGTAIKREVNGNIQLTGEELARAGRYVAILADEKKTFFVSPAAPSKLSFIARPSRVPVSTNDAVIGVAFVFDAQQNLVFQPANVKFDLAVNGASSFSRQVPAKNGVAWIRTTSGSREGAAQFVASLGGDSQPQKRIIQQVASDPCTIRMRAERRGNNVEVVTEPVRDCSGNAVPDGTIITFTQNAPSGRSTIDARVKRGIARATLPAVPNAVISVASGVVLGNEVRLGGGQ